MQGGEKRASPLSFWGSFRNWVGSGQALPLCWTLVLHTPIAQALPYLSLLKNTGQLWVHGNLEFSPEKQLILILCRGGGIAVWWEAPRRAWATRLDCGHSESWGRGRKKSRQVRSLKVEAVCVLWPIAKLAGAKLEVGTEPHPGTGEAKVWALDEPPVNWR
jgi:hypothetical protein